MAIRVVHLEDERDLREGMALVMEVEAPQVDLTQFSGSDTLIPYIDSNCGDIDLFILDVRVPGSLNGLQIAEHIRNIGCEAVIVITSAFDAPPVSVQENLRIHYFRKPWDLPESIVQMLALTSK
jgi:DNA-binding response OmpR family regulator